jgi:hypothetical protein
MKLSQKAVTRKGLTIFGAGNVPVDLRYRQVIRRPCPADVRRGKQKSAHNQVDASSAGAFARLLRLPHFLARAHPQLVDTFHPDQAGLNGSPE